MLWNQHIKLLTILATVRARQNIKWSYLNKQHNQKKLNVIQTYIPCLLKVFLASVRRVLRLDYFLSVSSIIWSELLSDLGCDVIGRTAYDWTNPFDWLAISVALAGLDPAAWSNDKFSSRLEIIQLKKFNLTLALHVKIFKFWLFMGKARQEDVAPRWCLDISWEIFQIFGASRFEKVDIV